MTKKVVPVALHKKKPIKRSNKRGTIFQKLFNYMKSDTYMFSPMICAQSSSTFSAASLGEGFGEPIKKKEKKLVQELEDYLKCDCYMYAPEVLLDSAVETASAPIGVTFQEKENAGMHCDLIEPRNGKMTQDGGNNMDSFREIVRDDSYNPTSRIAIKHALAQKETVRHVVRRKWHPTSIPGKGLLQKEARKVVVE